MATQIAEYVVQCLQHFKATLPNIDGLNTETRQGLLDEFARFKLWSGNIGAHRNGRSSLDWRLRDASHLRGLVIDLLTDLKNDLHDALSLLGDNLNTHNEATNESGDASIPEENSGSVDADESNGNTELHEIVVDIGDIIGCLLRLSVSIQNPAPHDHFMSSKFIDTSYFEEHDIRHATAKFPFGNPALMCRLGKAISQRRQYFRYREAHHHKLSSGLDVDSKSEVGAQSTLASSIPTVYKDTERSCPAFGRLDEEGLSNSDASQTSFASSGPESGRLKMPSLPKQAIEGPFDRPYCYMMLSVTTELQWRNHVSYDLRPYICLEMDCLTPENQYAKRHDWLEHLTRKHWRVFKCPFPCQDTEFMTRGLLADHLRQLHSELLSQDDLSVVLDQCERPRPWPEETECPLCHQMSCSKREYGRHVGRHQTELALFALPSNEEEDEQAEDGDKMREMDEVSDSDRSRLAEEQNDGARRSYITQSPPLHDDTSFVRSAQFNSKSVELPIEEPRTNQDPGPDEQSAVVTRDRRIDEILRRTRDERSRQEDLLLSTWSGKVLSRHPDRNHYIRE